MKPSTLNAHRARTSRVVQHLSAHLDDPIDSKALGCLAGLSTRQLDRVFKRTMGESPRAYARRLRLERAAVRLRTFHDSVLTLAVEAGFERLSSPQPDFVAMSSKILARPQNR